MAVEFSKEQLKVIETENRNILVSAAAGSGKTTVLVERIIRKICNREHPLDIDHLLIVTFTNAAAASMRQKITEALEKKLIEEPGDIHLQRQLVLVHNAQITTIDSFCLYVLKNNFNEIGLEPGFRVADEGEVRLLQEEVMENLLDDRFLREEFRKLADHFCTGAKLTPLTDVIYDVYNHALSYPFPLKWLKDQENNYGENMDYLLEILEISKKQIQECILETKELIKLCDLPDGPFMQKEILESDLSLYQRFMKTESYEAFWELAQNYSYDALSRKKGDGVDPVKREYIKTERDVLKKKMAAIKNQYFEFSLDFIQKMDRENHTILVELLDTVADFYERIQEIKKEKKLIDFSDMEHFALEILLKESGDGYEPSDTAKEYQDYYEEIMIDEYQDSNLVQEWLLKSISRESQGKFNRFMVGDVKQSIYRFRLACPKLFMEKYEQYTPDSKETMRIDLSKNYRSRAEILDSTNRVFYKIMGKDLGKVEYDENNALNLGANYLPKEAGMDQTELILLYKEENSLLSKQQEAKTVALKIRELVGNYMVEDETSHELRPAMYKDIVILLRNTKKWDEILKQSLQDYGIPTRITTREGYFSTVEIHTVMNVLQVLDNPRQDIPLYGMMHSEFGDFSEDEMAILAIARKENSCRNLVDLLPKIREFSSELFKEELILKVEAFWKRVEKYRRKRKYEPIHELLREIFDECSFLDRIAASAAGEQKKRNVLMLLEKAENFEKSSMKGLFSFIKYVEKLKKYKVEFGEAALNEEGMNAVQIMSIHKSKGLEFPICIVAGLGTQFNKQDIQSSFICDTDYGLAFDYVDLEKRAKYPNLRKNLLKQKILEDNLGEELRVLYVAFTRAKEKLILTGTLGKKRVLVKKSSRLSRGSRLDAASPLDWILAAAWEEDVFKVHDMGEEKIEEKDIEDALSAERRKAELMVEFQKNPRKEEAERLQSRIHQPYKHENLAELYTKTSVSELKIADMQRAYQKESLEEPAFLAFHDESQNHILPKFMKEEKVASGSDRGTAYHRVLELLPFEKMDLPFEREGAEKFLEGALADMRQSGRVDEASLELVRKDKILEFLSSSLGQRMVKAAKEKKLSKEQPFVLGIQATRLKESFPAEEQVLIQGIIDAFFEEDGEIVLMDYKTDAVKSGEELMKRYHSQLEYYKEAIERILGKKVREKILYSFSLNQEVPL